MKKLIIILTVLAVLTYTVSFVAATPPPVPPGGLPEYVPGYSLWGVFYLFTMFAGLYLLLNILPNITRMLKGGGL